MNEPITYETKCRRCGKLTQWAISCSGKNAFEIWQKAHEWFCAHLVTPSINHCKKCQKLTVQDYVSLQDKPSE